MWEATTMLRKKVYVRPHIKVCVFRTSLNKPQLMRNVYCIHVFVGWFDFPSLLFMCVEYLIIKHAFVSHVRVCQQYIVRPWG